MSDPIPPLPWIFRNGEPFDAIKANENWEFLRDEFNTTPGVFGPGTTQVNDVATFDNTTGSLLKNDGPAVIRGGASTFTFDPDTTGEESFVYSATTSGNATTNPTASGYTPYWWAKQTTTGLGLGVNSGVVMAEFDIDDNGTTVNGDSFVGVAGNANLLNTRPNAGVSGGTLAAAAIGGSMAARGIAHQGGNLGANQPQGEIHGLNVVAGVSAIGPTAPSDYIDHEGIEVDMVGGPGLTVKYRVGVYVSDFSVAAELGTDTDAAFAIGSVGGATGWLLGIDFVGPPFSTGNAIHPTLGSLLGSSNASFPTVARHGIDLFNFTISDFAFRGPNGFFSVSGSGDVVAESYTATTSGFIVDTATVDSAFIEFRSSGVAKWDVGREGVTDDFIIKDAVGGDVNLRITAAGVTAGGSTNPITISDTGVLSVPGAGMTVGPAPSGGALGAGTVNIQSDLTTGSATFLHRTSATLTDHAAGFVGTMTNAPVAGDPFKWIAIDDNGVTLLVPGWKV